MYVVDVTGEIAFLGERYGEEKDIASNVGR
jgi:hypothetical protein